MGNIIKLMPVNKKSHCRKTAMAFLLAKASQR
jgi:hypothetical protein